MAELDGSPRRGGDARDRFRGGESDSKSDSLDDRWRRSLPGRFWRSLRAGVDGPLIPLRARISLWISSNVRVSRVLLSLQSLVKVLTSTDFFICDMDFVGVLDVGAERGGAELVRCGSRRGEDAPDPGPSDPVRPSWPSTSARTENSESSALARVPFVERNSFRAAFSLRPNAAGSTFFAGARFAPVLAPVLVVRPPGSAAFAVFGVDRG